MGLRGPQPKDFCVNGHSLVGENVTTVVTKRGYIERRCKKCLNKRAREWWRKNRAKTNTFD